MSDKYEFEKSFWKDCCHTLTEENKQVVYARHMALGEIANGWLKFSGRVMDIGGGPISMLLKCDDVAGSVIVDPINYPAWTTARYAAKGIGVWTMRGEDLPDLTDTYDEVWIYNCLQHVDDPKLIIEKAKHIAPCVRMFEWVNIPAYKGHPQELKTTELREWLGAPYAVVDLTETFGYGAVAFVSVYDRRTQN
jgi:hypothetical protein